MSSERKTIQINPEFLKFSNGGKTRKKKPDKPIKMKPVTPENNNKTTKRKILNYIRKQQEDAYKNLLKGELTEALPKIPVEPISDIKSDFEQSLDFMENIAKQNNETVRKPLNTTLKARPSDSVLFSGNNVFNQIMDENVAIEPPENVFDAVMAPVFQSGPAIVLAKPQYGCLKGGTLPTYRAWKNQTQKHVPSGDHRLPIERKAEA